MFYAVHEPYMMFLLLACVLGMALLPALAEAPRRTLIRNADLVLTMEPQLGDGALGGIRHGDVLITGAHVVEATGKIVLPGFVDVHNHLWQSLIRGCGTDMALSAWLQAYVLPVAHLNVTAQEVYAVVRLSTLDLLAAGVTTVVDWSHAFSPDFARGNVQALLDSGLRFAFAYRGSLEQVEEMRALKRDLIDPIPRASFQVGGPQPRNTAASVQGFPELQNLPKYLK